MARKKLYELDTATTTLTKYAGVDVSGSTAAEKVLWPYHFVSTLPASPVQGHRYFLDTATGNFPIGAYEHNGTGWFCVAPHGEVTLADWGATDITPALVDGVTYLVTVTAAPTSFQPTLLTNGVCDIVIANASTFTIPEPTTGYKMTSNGLDALSAASVSLTLQRTGGVYEFGATERIAL